MIRNALRHRPRPVRFLWWFIPEASVAREAPFQRVMVSRFCSDAAIQALIYGSLVSVVREESSAFGAALVGCAALVPPALFGLPGGIVADLLPKRLVLAVTYLLQAALCFVLPEIAGTGLSGSLVLVFAVVTLGQISGAAEPALIPLVANEERIASANSFLNIASVAGAGFGTAILAPFFVRFFDVEPLYYVCGGLLLLAMARIFERGHVMEGSRVPGVEAGPIATLRWFASERVIVTMILAAALVGIANTIVQTLAPRYVQEEFGLDPSASVYVLAPASIGLVLALVLAPLAIRLLGERAVAAVAIVITGSSLFGLGTLDLSAKLIDRFNVLRLIDWFGPELTLGLRTASLLALPLGFGLAAGTSAVSTYLNRNVEPTHQGRAFAMQSVLRNGLAIPPLLVLGAAAELWGVQRILIASPFLIALVGFGVVRLLRVRRPRAIVA